MKINLRQEIALWVLGLLWTGIGILGFADEAGSVVQVAGILLVLLVPIFLIVFSLRDRKKGL
jgi:hypothetical protein